MQIEQQGPDHAVVFRASLNFQVPAERAANEVTSSKQCRDAVALLYVAFTGSRSTVLRVVTCWQVVLELLFGRRE